jgi:hypothetical protein
VTLTNTTGTTFTNADTLLVAGNVGGNGNYDDDYGGYRPPPPPRPAGNRSGTQTPDRESLGDFYLYPLKERTTIADKQTKQVGFLDVSSARDTGLGDALPAGTVRVYQKDARGNAQFDGENRICHTPMGSDIAITTGQTFDVKVQPVVEKRERLGSGRWRTTMRYTLTNARPQAVTVDVIQSGLWGDVRVESESAKSTRRSADETAWRVTVPANGEATVTATFDTRY